MARPGDWIVTNLDAQGQPLRDCEGNLNQYVIAAGRFADLYAPTGVAGEQADLGLMFSAKATVKAIQIPGGFDLIAPWGERQKSESGYLLLNGTEVYGNQKETFEQTYEVLPSS